MKQASRKRAWIAGLVFALMGAVAGGALAGISTTRHNLSSGNAIATATDGSSTTIRSTDQDEICVFCHTPHQALKNNNIPLWNHNLSTQASYGVYTSLTYSATDTADLGGKTEVNAEISNLCLSCHDGTVAINSFNNPSNTNASTLMVGTKTDGTMPDNVAGVFNANLGSDLTNDHPVNFTYDAALVTRDGGTSLKAPSALTGVKLFNNKVQCASCHDPHTSADPSGKAFLRVAQTGSALCFACHTK